METRSVLQRRAECKHSLLWRNPHCTWWHLLRFPVYKAVEPRGEFRGVTGRPLFAERQRCFLIFVSTIGQPQSQFLDLLAVRIFGSRPRPGDGPNPFTGND